MYIEHTIEELFWPIQSYIKHTHTNIYMKICLIYGTVFQIMMLVYF